MATPFQCVVERFPQQAGLVVKLAQQSDEFRSLCEDYTLVVETLARLQDQKLPTSDSAVEEYRSYQLELELDIADALTRRIP